MSRLSASTFKRGPEVGVILAVGNELVTSLIPRAAATWKGPIITDNQDAPLGWFHAVRTRDAVAQARDGWPYFEANLRGSDHTGATVFEIRFGDGEWMLAAEGDLLKRDQ